VLNKQPVTTLQVAIELLNQVRDTYSTDSRRLYVTGISMGGFATWAAIMHYPDLFAAAIPVCGGGDTSNAYLVKDIPIWNFHGAEDRVVPPELSRDMIQALHEAGGSPGYTEYPDVGHDSWIPAYQEPYLFEWLFEQRKI
jgi:predicted peptidase